MQLACKRVIGLPDNIHFNKKVAHFSTDELWFLFYWNATPFTKEQL